MFLRLLRHYRGAPLRATLRAVCPRGLSIQVSLRVYSFRSIRGPDSRWWAVEPLWGADTPTGVFHNTAGHL